MTPRALAGQVDPELSRPGPPAFVSTITQPAPPQPTPSPVPPDRWRRTLNQPMPALVTLDGIILPAPTDGIVRAKPPAPPKGAA